MTTAWTQYVTPSYTGFTIGCNMENEPAVAIDEKENRRLRGHYDHQQHQIVTRYNSEDEVRVSPSHVTLEAWTRHEEPVIDIHPIGVLHLYATRLVTPVMVANLLSRAPAYTFAARLDEANPILGLLGVRQAIIRVSTTADICVSA